MLSEELSRAKGSCSATIDMCIGKYGTMMKPRALGLKKSPPPNRNGGHETAVWWFSASRSAGGWRWKLPGLRGPRGRACRSGRAPACQTFKRKKRLQDSLPNSFGDRYRKRNRDERFFSTDINASYAFFLHALRAMLVCTKDRKCKSSLSTWERLNVRNYRKLIRKIIVRKWGQFVISFGMCCSESISEHLERRGYLEFRS